MRTLAAGTISALALTGASAVGGVEAASPAEVHPMELVFVRKDDGRERYLQGLPLTIRDAHHRVVFEGLTDGPLFHARLPRGDYLVTARWGDGSFSRLVRVGENYRRVVFEWKKGWSTRG